MRNVFSIHQLKEEINDRLLTEEEVVIPFLELYKKYQFSIVYWKDLPEILERHFDNLLFDRVELHNTWSEVDKAVFFNKE